MTDTRTPDPWIDADADWFAALVAGGATYGVARRRHVGDDLRYEVYIPETDSWVPTGEGPGYFTGIGGVTDAEPVTPAEAADIVRGLLEAWTAALAAEAEA